MTDNRLTIGGVCLGWAPPTRGCAFPLPLLRLDRGWRQRAATTAVLARSIGRGKEEFDRAAGNVASGGQGRDMASALIAARPQMLQPLRLEISSYFLLAAEGRGSYTSAFSELFQRSVGAAFTFLSVFFLGKY
jgi:hypothetical protein